VTGDRHARRRLRAVVAWLAAIACAACFEFSPHELPTERSDEGVHWKSLEALASIPPQVALRFAVVGDTQRSFSEAREIVSAVNRRGDVAFLVQAGDFTHLGLTFEFEKMNEVFRELRVPYFVVVGTHDLLGNGRAVYEHMFGPLDFAFTYARVRWVLLNTCSREFAFAPDVPDLAWLAAQLAPDAAHDRAVVFGHVAPNGPDFNAALRDPYYALLREAGVSLTVFAHAHDFEVFEEFGVTLVIADSAEHRSFVIVTLLPDGGFDIERVFF
jgi:3',5'-cyclic-AMP phosphodiesterase